MPQAKAKDVEDEATKAVKAAAAEETAAMEERIMAEEDEQVFQWERVRTEERRQQRMFGGLGRPGP